MFATTFDSNYTRPSFKLRAQWEWILAAFGLSEAQQLRRADVVVIYRESPDETGERDNWQASARRQKLDAATDIPRFGQVPVRVYLRDAPQWVFSDAKLVALLDCAFPLRRRKNKQRRKAARWIYVAYHYWRALRSTRGISDDLGISEKAVECMLARIKAVGEKLFTDLAA